MPKYPDRIMLRMPSDLMDNLRDESERTDLPVSTIIRQALRAHLSRSAATPARPSTLPQSDLCERCGQNPKTNPKYCSPCVLEMRAAGRAAARQED